MKALLPLLFLSLLAGCGNQAAANADSAAPAADCCGDGGCCADKKDGATAKEGDACCADKKDGVTAKEGDACCADKAAKGDAAPCCAENAPAKPAEAPKPKN